jgi:hypothetical protein
MADLADRELGWNDEISNEVEVFQLLTPGEYNFKVKSFTRARFPGSAKLIPCNQAVLAIDILDAENNVLATIPKHSLFLTEKMSGMVNVFFRSIGARCHGEKMIMDWNKVTGATGRCVIENKELQSTKTPGEKFSVNNIKKFLDPVDESDIPF